MRPVIGMGWGAVYGAGGAVLANLVLAVVVGASMSLAQPEEFASAIGLALVIVVFGTLVAFVVGILAGGFCGLLIGAIRIERHAPVVAAVAATGVPLVMMASSFQEGLGAGDLDSVQFYVTGVVALIGFAGSGYVAGAGFRRSSPWGGTSRSTGAGPMVQPDDTMIESRDLPAPAVTWPRPDTDPYRSSKPVNSRITRP